MRYVAAACALLFTISWTSHADIVPPQIQGLPAKIVAETVVNHATERRGFVTVPIDYDDPHSATIQVFYRWIPSTGAANAPTLIYINGGPGYPSSYIRALDYDYVARPTDALTELLELFNVVLVDQRGTDGNSFPLEQTSPLLEQEAIARYLHSDFLALDHAAVGETLMAEGLLDPLRYYVFGHSFGSSVASNFIRLQGEGKISLRPTGFILSAGASLENSGILTWAGARPVQQKIGQELVEWARQSGRGLPIHRLMDDMRDYLTEARMSPDVAHFLYADLMSDDFPSFYKAARKMRDEFSEREVVEEYIRTQTDCFNYLAHVLNVQSSNEGLLNGEVLQYADQMHPQPFWIIDPIRAWAFEERYVPHRYQELVRLQRSGRMYFPKHASARQIQDLVRSGTRLLFHYGRRDIVAGAESAESFLRESLGKDLARDTVALTEGGHRDIRSRRGVELIRRHFGL